MDIHEKCADLYRDRFNNFLTLECFASWYGLPESLAKEILKHGEFVHENQVKAAKRA